MISLSFYHICSLVIACLPSAYLFSSDAIWWTTKLLPLAGTQNASEIGTLVELDSHITRTRWNSHKDLYATAKDHKGQSIPMTKTVNS